MAGIGDGLPGGGPRWRCEQGRPPGGLDRHGCIGYRRRLLDRRAAATRQRICGLASRSKTSPRLAGRRPRQGPRPRFPPSPSAPTRPSRPGLDRHLPGDRCDGVGAAYPALRDGSACQRGLGRLRSRPERSDTYPAWPAAERDQAPARNASLSSTAATTRRPGPKQGRSRSLAGRQGGRWEDIRQCSGWTTAPAKQGPG